MVRVPSAPAVDSLAFRMFRGSEDFPGMVDVFSASKAVDRQEFSWSVEDMARSFEHPINFSPKKDVLIATIKEKIIGHARVWWTREFSGTRYYHYSVRLDPHWRGRGIREAMVEWCEIRAREIASGHPASEVGWFYAISSDAETDWTRIIESKGFKPHTYSFHMLRPSLDDIPDFPLPTGIEIRPILKDRLRDLWDADAEASRDGFEPIEWPEELYQQWLNEPMFKPELYIVAWDGDRIAGAVQNHIDDEENSEYRRKRGYTENIHVGRQWRGKGLAKGMLAISFRLLRDMGMTEAALNVDAENPTGALRLYESMGFGVEKRFMHYRKEMKL